jgi:PDZ domain-containing protein
MEPNVTLIDQRPDDAVPSAPSRRIPKWPFVLAGVLFAIGIAIAALWPIELDYYTRSPGPVYDTSDFVEVPEGNASNVGELFFLTVVQKQANVFEYLVAQIDPEVRIVPRENVRPPDVSPEQLRRENLAAMEESKTNAKFVALSELGYDPTFIGTGALVIDTVPGSAAAGVLEPDDVIVALNGKPVGLRSDVIDLLADKQIGDVIMMIVEREGQELELTIVLGPHTDDPERPMIGVLLDNNPPIVEFPVEVNIDSANIGGPSAGLMFTLQIIDQLTEEPLTAGLRVAGTGTISADGTVGPIGGVQQKVYAAIDAGADVVLVPALNYDDAVEVAGDDIIVVRVAEIGDALDYLYSL